MHSPWRFAYVAVLALVHCGSSTPKAPTEPGSGSGSGGAISCGDDGSCPNGYTCGFEIGSCSAKGQCIPVEQSTGTCNISQVFCGCGDAGPVYAGCSNYASAPTAGNQDCKLPDQAIPPDAGPDGSSLEACAAAATKSPCATECGHGEICAQAPPPDIGCVADASADSGLSCARAPGSCRAMPTLGSGDACTSLLNQLCSSNGAGQPDGGAFGSVEALPGGGFAVVCENEP
jgi:hypothetical protein